MVNVGRRSVAWMAGAIVGLSGWAASLGWAQESVIEDSPASAAVSESSPTAGLNLWRPSGRPRVIVDRQTREILETIEIIDRPNRPLHFYGNAVRRRHYGPSGWSAWRRQ